MIKKESINDKKKVDAFSERTWYSWLEIVNYKFSMHDRFFV